MTKTEAERIARAIKHELPTDQQMRLKAIHIVTRLHDAMTTIRLYFINRAADEPDPFVFNADELD